MNTLQNLWHLAPYFGGLPLGGLLFTAFVVYAFTLGDYEPHGGLRAAKVKAAQIPDRGRSAELVAQAIRSMTCRNKACP
jgi:hypothetical protein